MATPTPRPSPNGQTSPPTTRGTTPSSTADAPTRDPRLVNLDPVVGSEAARTRRAVVVSNDGANTTASRLGRGVVTVVPVTSNTDRVYPFQVLLPADETGLDFDSKAQAEQVRSVAVERIGEVVGSLRFELAEQLDEALRVHLDL